MRIFAPLGPARTLATGRILRRGVLLGTLALAERILTAATAWVLFGQSIAVKVAVSVALGAVFTSRTFLRQALSPRTEAELLDRVIGCVLRGDLLRISVLPDEDAQADLGQGVYLSAQQLSDVLPCLGADIVSIALLSVAVASVEPGQLVVGATALAGLGAVGLMFSYGRLHRAVRGSWDLRDRVIDKMVDALGGRLEIVASGECSAFVAGVHERARAWGTASLRAAAASTLSGRVPLAVVASAVAVMVAVDSRWMDSLHATLGDVALLASVTPAFAGVAQGLVALVQTEPMTRVVSQVVLDAQPKRAGKAPPPSHSPIVFDAVSFRYEGADTDALGEISLAWRDERVIALSGANGSGKSTCLRLLLALGRPTGGAIRVCGADLAELDADAWRKRIAFLPQRPYLPMRTDVRAAVRLLAREASDERIVNALGRVGMLETLRRIRPDPLAVSVDALSVGQRQRLALARMLCRDALIFVLDEPDANLDRAGIELVANLIRELAIGHTVILAAHTPELLRLANRVVVLDNGRVVGDERSSPE
jgi:ABC-type multidrug transport system fused ATPase/permease subunit